MRVRSWAGTWLGLVPALLLTASAFGDELKFADPALLSADISCAGDEASGCEPCCCEPAMCCCDCRSPYWSVEAGAVFLRRDHQTDVPLTNGATPISVGDLAFNDYQGGPAVTLIRHDLLGSRTSLEVTYFGVRDSNSATTAGATAFFSVPTINFGARNVSVDYRSSLDSTEINFRDTFADWFTLLGGFRWVELSDELSTDFGGGNAPHQCQQSSLWRTDWRGHFDFGQRSVFDRVDREGRDLWQRGRSEHDRHGRRRRSAASIRQRQPNGLHR